MKNLNRLFTLSSLSLFLFIIVCPKVLFASGNSDEKSISNFTATHSEYITTTPVDTDGDGIPDNVDRDDDNDGIPDEEECKVEFFEIINGGFEDPVIPASTWKLKNDYDVPGWNTTATDHKIEFWSTGFLSTPSQEGNQFVELNANQVSTLYQSFTLSGSGGTIDWSLYHRGRRGVETAYVKIGETVETATVVETMSDGTTAWGYYSGTYTIPQGQTTLVIAFESLIGGSYGNLLDDVKMALNQTCPDSDNDGIPNSLDLDSDNDGIPDIREAGGIDLDNDGQVDYAISGDPTSMVDLDGDGLIDLYDDEDNGGSTAGWTGGGKILDLDSDGDGVANRLDLDSDNDGIADYIENVCSTCPTAAGPVGYTADTDGNGVLDIYENMTSDNTDNVSGSNVGVIPNVEPDDTADLLPDYIDNDTDGDGAYDWVEGFDNSGDGNAADDIIALALQYEIDNGNPGEYPTTDSDADGIPDWLDNLPNASGYTEGSTPPFLDHSHSSFIDNNNNGLADLFDELMNGFKAPTPDTDNSNDNDWRDNATLSALPVELVSFKLTMEACNVRLEWVSETEELFDHFQLQRSSDGANFETIARVLGQGGDTYQIYKYLDNSSAGNNYYRLKMVDIDGSFEYSEVILSISECDQQISNNKLIAYPNPIGLDQSRVYLKIHSSGTSGKIVLCDVSGVVHKIIENEFNEGWNSLTVDVDGLPAGMYTISYIRKDGATITRPMVIAGK